MIMGGAVQPRSSSAVRRGSHQDRTKCTKVTGAFGSCRTSSEKCIMRISITIGAAALAFALVGCTASAGRPVRKLLRFTEPG
jgi:hypothetical protein